MTPNPPASPTPIPSGGPAPAPGADRAPAPLFRRTSSHLADGRELIYFDDSEPYVSGGATRRLDDPRPLGDRFAPGPDGAAFVGPQMRYDVLTGDWVPMASHRMNRTFLPPAGACPLCPARPGAQYSDGEIPDTDYDVAVFENRFPSYLRAPGADPAEQWSVDGQELWPARHAAGRCEVVCFSSDHAGTFAGLPARRVRTIVEAWVDRTEALMAMPGIEQVYCFENCGQEIGVTLAHPHGQIYGYPNVTPKTAAMLRQAAAHRQATGGNLLRDVLEAELRAGTRVVLESDHWVGYVPAAARWPVEVHLAPRRDVVRLVELGDAEREDLARTYLRMLGMLNRFFVEPDGAPITLPYISGWHQAPQGGEDLLRLHLQAFSILRAPGKLKYLAGSESGMAAWISDTTPERIAARMRQVAE